MPTRGLTDLLAVVLRSLVRAGVVERTEVGNRVSYELSAAGRELQPIVEALGAWGIRWIAEPGDEDLDPHLLMWDIHRNIALEALPAGRTVLYFEFTDISGEGNRWWIVVTDEGIDVCNAAPGFDVRVGVEEQRGPSSVHCAHRVTLKLQQKDHKHFRARSEGWVRGRPGSARCRPLLLPDPTTSGWLP